MNRPISAQSRNDTQLAQKSMRKLAETADVMERMRLLCLTRGSSGIIGLGRVFRNMDDDGSKQLNFGEFERGIVEFGITDILPEEMQEMFGLFDKDGSGSVSYDEFLRSIRPPLSAARKKLIMDAYNKLDKSGDGQVTIEDLKNVYSVKHHPQYLNGELSEDEILRKFLGNFEGNNADGTVTDEEFMNYYGGVSASIDSDGYFDLMMRNCWKL